jgi:hypothetical protein
MEKKRMKSNEMGDFLGESISLKRKTLTFGKAREYLLESVM